MYSKIKSVATLSLIFLLLIVPAFVQELYASGDPGTSTIKVCGYVKPDFTFDENVSSLVKSGFKVEIDELKISAVTDANGYFEICDVPGCNTVYSLNITRPSYLKRNLRNVIAPVDLYVQGKLQISTPEAPILMYAGDMARNGVQDNAVNLCDIMVLAKSFNTKAGNTRYNSDADINKDSEINMLDIILAADHFNTTPDIYPDDVTPLPGVLYINAINEECIDVALSRDLQTLDKNDFSIDGLSIQDLSNVTDNYYGSEKASKHIIRLITSPQTPGEACKLLFNGQEYEFTCFQGVDAALGTLKADGFTAQYIKDDHSQVKVSWEPLTQMQINTTHAKEYKVLCYSTDINKPEIIPVTDLKCSSLLISGLNINKEYKFAICVSNETAQSPLSQYITASGNAPLAIGKPTMVSALNNNEIAVVFDNEVSDCSIDDFYVYTDLKVDSVKPMNGNKNTLILSTSNQVPGYTYRILYKNKVYFTFTGSGLKSSDFEAEALSSKVVAVTLGTGLLADSLKGNEFTVKNQNGSLLNIISAKPDESDVLRRTVLLTLASDMKEGTSYTLVYGNTTVNFTINTANIKRPVLESVYALSASKVELRFTGPIYYTGAKFEAGEVYGARKPLEVTGVKYNGRNAVVLAVNRLRDCTLYKVFVSNLNDLSGNIIEPFSATFSGMSDYISATTFDHPDALKIVKVQSYSSRIIIAEFSSSPDPDTIVSSNFKISEAYGSKTPLTISSVRQAKKGDTNYDGILFASDEMASRFVILSLDNYPSGILYKLETQNVYSPEGASISLSGNNSVFTGNYTLLNPCISRITGIEYVGTSDTEITVSFDQNPGSTASDTTHYTINNGIGNPLKAEILPDEPNTVKLTIPKLEPGKIYTLTVKDLENSDGVSMNPEGIFLEFASKGGSLAQRISTITGIEYIGTSNTEIVVSFDQNVGSTATDISHYSINNDVGYPSKAEILPYQPNKVKLTIPVLTLGKIYTLTVKNLENSDGVPMLYEGVNSVFVGKQDLQLPEMLAVLPIDNQTIKIYFGRGVSNSQIDGPIWNSKTNSLVDKALSYSVDGNIAVDLEDANEYVYRDPTHQNALIIRIDTLGAFKSGNLKLIGDPLKFSADSNELVFPCNSNDPNGIVVDNVAALNSMTVRVYFNMPVYGTLNTFADINTRGDYGLPGAIALSNPIAVDDTYKVYDFKLSSALTPQTYYLNVNPKVAARNDIIKDKPTAGIGYVGMKDEDKSTPGLDHPRLFAGISTMPQDIKDVYAVMVDEKTLKIYYPTLMNESDVENPGNYFLSSSPSGDTPSIMGIRGIDFSPSLHIGHIVYNRRDNTATITLNATIQSRAAYIKFSTSIRNANLTAYVNDETYAICKQFAISSAASRLVKFDQASYDSTSGVLTIEMNQLFKTTTNITGPDAQELLNGISITVGHNNGYYSIYSDDISEVKALDSNGNSVDSSAAYANKIRITFAQALKEQIVAYSVGKAEITAPNNFIGINGNSGSTDTTVLFAQ